MESLFKLVGISYASEGHKAPPFAESFKALGLLVDAGNFNQGSIELGHTPERKAELIEAIGSIVLEGHTTPKALEKLHGRLVWYNSFVFGRKLNFSVRCISKYARLRASNVSVGDELLEALTFVDTHLRTAKPTRVTVNLTAPWIVFIDGAYEPSQQEPGSIGGVLVDPSGRVVEFFGCSVNEDLMEEFLLESSHPIYELELFPIVVAVRLWSQHFVDALLVHYIDNDAACSALVRADGATRLARALVNQYVDFEYKCKFFPWFARVPSHSNLMNLRD